MIDADAAVLGDYITLPNRLDGLPLGKVGGSKCLGKQDACGCLNGIATPGYFRQDTCSRLGQYCTGATVSGCRQSQSQCEDKTIGSPCMESPTCSS